MKVSFFNSYLQGGAANAAINLYNSLDGINKTFYYKENIPERHNKIVDADSSFERVDAHKSNYRSVVQRLHKSLKARSYYSQLNKLLSNKPSGFEQFSVPNQFTSTPISFFSNDPGIIHLHWIAEWIDYTSFFNSLSSNTPVVWTLHDMNPFTAGCHFSLGCDRYIKGCDICPQLASDNSVDTFIKKKVESISRLTNLHVVAPSNWLSDLASKSIVFKNAKHYVIPYAVDIEIFHPSFKRNIHFKSEALKVLYVSADLDNPRKGFHYFKSLTEQFNDTKEIEFYSVGDNITKSDSIKQLGRIDSKQELARVYSSADLLIMPSIEDNLPNVVLESMACGTPVIGFDVGGMVDMVHHNQNGFLFKVGDIKAMAKVIADCNQNRVQLKEMAARGVNLVRESFSTLNQFEAYKKIYQEVSDVNLMGERITHA